MYRVAYYAHHHGSGHIRNALNIASSPDIEISILSSASVSESIRNALRFTSLESNVVEGVHPTVGQPFHRTPVGSRARNVQRRARSILEELASFEPDVVVCDVSAEITSLVRLGGFPTIVRRMHGGRADLAHRNMYANADQIVTYFPSTMDRRFIEEHSDKYTEIGTFPVEVDSGPSTPGLVVVQSSLGGGGIDLQWVNEAARQTPKWTWRFIGLTQCDVEPESNVEVLGVVEDPMAHLVQAQVIVTSAGQNAVRCAASARRPLLLVPEERPFDEQVCFANALQNISDAEVVDPRATNWPSTLARAVDQDPEILFREFFVSKERFHRSCADAVRRALAAAG